MSAAVATRRPGRSLFALVALALLALVALFVYRLGAPGGVERGGPVNEPGWLGTSVPITVGETVAAAPYQFFNNGKETAILESARPLGLPPELELLRTYAIGKDRPHQHGGGMYEWPDESTYPKALLRPVAGFKATPERGSETIGGTNIVFLLRATKPGDWSFDFVELRYRVGDQEYRRIVTNTWTGCARAPSKRDHTCFKQSTAPSDAALAKQYDAAESRD